MESFKNLHRMKTEKANRNQKHRQLRMIGNLLRYAEMCVVLVLISRLSIQQLPLALKYTSEYFSAFMLSTRFVFLIGNIIIITLFVQSGHFSAPKDGSQEPDLYLEFHQSSTINQKNLSMTVESGVKGQRIDKRLVKYPEKKSTKPKTKTKNKLEEKDYRRCKSEITRQVQNEEKALCVLQRCDTDNSRRSIEGGGGGASETEKAGKSSYPEDDMSNDEFRSIVEAFIARQQRLRTQELQDFSS